MDRVRNEEVRRRAVIVKLRGSALLVRSVYERAIVSRTLYGVEAWVMRGADRRKVNVLQMKCFEKFGWSVTHG